jgi:4'-phosphopantetheinyl transferase EntD
MRIKGEIARSIATPKEQVFDNVLSIRISQAKRLLFDAALESAFQATYEDTIFDGNIGNFLVSGQSYTRFSV